jgi:alkylation response protein AidB-like acyl-CoA dehydrogenase
VRHGSAAQKENYLRKIASGTLRLQSMAVTEPTTGSDTTQLKTSAVRRADRYVVNGQKVWISRVRHSDLLLLLARTTPLADVKKKSDGMSIFIVDIKEAMGKGMTLRSIPNMVNHETNEVFFDDLEIPAGNLIGAEGEGFRYLLDGLNAERALIAAECIGDGYWFVERATCYANERRVFDRPIGRNQGVQFPIAEAFIEVEDALQGVRALRGASALRRRGQHGEISGGQGVLGGGERLPADAWRLWLRQRIRRGTQVSRDASLPGGADLHQLDLLLHRRARSRLAALLLRIPRCPSTMRSTAASHESPSTGLRR